MPQDACYHKVKAQYKVFPSARASQAIAKCRKSKGKVTKSEKGTSLKRWEKEKWIDTNLVVLADLMSIVVLQREYLPKLQRQNQNSARPN